MEPIGSETQEEVTAEPVGRSQAAPSRAGSIILGGLGAGILIVLAVLLMQANTDKQELQDSIDSSNAEVSRLTSDLDTANSQLASANSELQTAAGVQESIVDFIAVSLTLGGGISERDGRCVAENMDSQLGTELLLRSSLAAAGLTPNAQDGREFTAGLAEAAAACGVPLNSPNASPAISGVALAPYAPSGADAAIGATAPTVTGVDFEGNEVQIGGTGRPTAIVFVAHWCPHCQQEVPQVQEWLDSTGGVAGVEVVSVATSNDSTRANYPPWEWLKREGWTPPVLADDQGGSAMAAFGGTAFPYWVFLNADGTVAARLTGTTDITTLDALMQSIAP